MKNILDRKNAKNVLELANKGLNANQIAKKLGIWYNVANYLFKELKSAGLVSVENNIVETNKGINLDMLKSTRKQILVDMFKENSIVTQKAIVERIKLSRLPADMLEDLRALELYNVIESKVVKNRKVYTLL